MFNDERSLYLGPTGGPTPGAPCINAPNQAARARKLLVLANQLFPIRFLLIDSIESQFQPI